MSTSPLSTSEALVEHVLGELHRAGRAERPRLLHVAQPHSPYSPPSTRRLRTPKRGSRTTSPRRRRRARAATPACSAMNGRLASGTTGLGTVEVSGRSRVPSPPASIWPASARTSLPIPSYMRPAPRTASASSDVAPVDDHGSPPCACATSGQVELRELRPFGDHHDRVRAFQRVHRRVHISTPVISSRARSSATGS